MAYSNFKSLRELEDVFGVKNQRIRLFDTAIAPIEPQLDLQKALNTAQELPIKSEKARAELIVTELLGVMQHIVQQYKS